MATTATEPTKSPEPVNILLVDDRPENLVALESVLASLGQNLVKAQSGREALRHLLQEDFAVILLDVQMPEMDGFETATLIRARERSRHTPIVFLTAINKTHQHVARGYSVGAVDYVFKPFDPDVLRAKVAAFVELSRKQQELEAETIQRRKAEEEVRKLNAELERRVHERTAELEAANRELDATRRRLLFLSEASAMLAHSLEYATTIEQVAQLPIPYLADFCIVELIDDEGFVRKVASAHRDPHRAEWLAAVEYRYPPALDAGSVSARVAVAGLPELRVGRECAEWFTRPTEMEPLAALSPSACLAVPLIARSRTIGVITLGLTEPGRLFGAAEVSLAEDFARRAAAAIDNARLFHEVQEADRRKDEFLAMLAHELRNPLAAISNADYALSEIGTDDPRVRRLREIISRQCHNLSRLVDDLLDISRVTRGKIGLRTDLVELAPILQRAIDATQPLIAARGHELHVALPSEPICLRGDATRLEQIFANLLNNAAKYTEPGGRIELTVERIEPPGDSSEEIGIPDPLHPGALLPYASGVCVRVRDTGIGISPRLLPRIFDLFTQAERSLDRSQGGLGIGLALVKRLVELHGGDVHAMSEGLGKGSEFIVRLPAEPSARRQCGTAAAGCENAKPGRSALPHPFAGALVRRRILLVEDNLDAAETLTEILELWGHEVRVAHDGPSGIEAAQAFRPEVVLLDLGLPGMDGYEVCRRLRQWESAAAAGRTGKGTANGGNGRSRAAESSPPRPEQTRGPENPGRMLVVALTGYGQDEDRRRSEEAGFDLHVTKPVDPQALQALLQGVPLEALLPGES